MLVLLNNKLWTEKRKLAVNNMDYTHASTYKNYGHTGSDKYDLVNTGALIELIKNNSDLEVTRYAEAGVRAQGRLGKQNHIVRMRPKGLMNMDAPELVISNSYDKTRALHVDFGFFRIVCLNGLICGDSILGFKSRHINFDYDGLLGFVQQFSERSKNVIAQVDLMKSRTLSPDAKLELAHSTYALKKGIEWNELSTERDIKVADYEANRLLGVRRIEDKDDSAWTVFNRVQENVIRGRRGGYGQLRATNDIKKQIKLNRFMWDKTLELVA